MSHYGLKHQLLGDWCTSFLTDCAQHYTVVPQALQENVMFLSRNDKKVAAATAANGITDNSTVSPNAMLKHSICSNMQCATFPLPGADVIVSYN
jgi:hypothetical protein